MISKSELRQQIRAALLEQPQGALREASAAIRKRVLESPAWQEARVVGFFAAQPLEPFVDPLLEVAVAAGKRAVYPRVTSHGLALVEVFSPADLQETPRWKLREPAEHLREVAPGEVELLFVPGLAFDRAGHRLGRGGGFYDRLLSEVLSAVRCGICFHLQLLPEVPMETHDQSVSVVLTEQETLDCPEGL